MLKNFVIPFLLLSLSSCSITLSAAEKKAILLATTTSTENSGLLNYLLPEIEQDIGYSVKVISTGTGKALKMGESGDVDVLLVHAKNSELAFVESGFGVNRVEIMYNDFVVVGPKGDAAAANTASTAVEAFGNIWSNSALFLSRGDDSGTHKKELQLWGMLGRQPEGTWYREVGQGMGKTLQIANELGAYTLTDRGTWISIEEQLNLTILFQGDPPLHNQYSVIVINPDRHDINFAGADALTKWMSSEKGQALIDAFEIKGQKLFYANAN